VAIQHVIEYQGEEVYTLFPFSDLHIGNEGCDEAAIREAIAQVAADPHALWVDLGDGCEFINRHDKRFDVETLPDWLWNRPDLAMAETERRVSLFKGIADKCVGLVAGNHEAKLLEYAENDVYRRFAKDIGAEGRCLGPCGFLRLIFRAAGAKEDDSAWVVTLFLTHGFWGGRFLSSTALNLERLAGQVECDLLLSGHDHKKALGLVEKLVLVEDDRGELGEATRTTFCVACGTFLRTTAYAERAGFRPSNVGMVRIAFHPRARAINVDLGGTNTPNAL
jgi:predicted phosphodiesterase